MRVEVFDEDIIGKDFMGYANVILEECLKNPGFSPIFEIFYLILK